MPFLFGKQKKNILFYLNNILKTWRTNILNNIYILYKLENRAETTDTILYYASKDKGLLEEIMLSIWEEAKEIIWEAMERNPNITKNEKECALELYIRQFGITSIPEVI